MNYDVLCMLLLITRTALIVAYFVAFVLYTRAYFLMKRTRIIGSVALTFYALMLHDTYFLLRFMFDETQCISGEIIFQHPLLTLIPKFIMLLVVMYFVWASVTPDNIAKEIIHDGGVRKWEEKNKKK